MNENGKGCNLKNYIIAVILSVAVAIGVGYAALQYGFYLQGSAIYEQLYKLEIIADSMQAGNWYPLYAEHWYNGYEVFRYSSAVVYLLVYGLSRIAGNDIHTGIAVFYGVLTFMMLMGFLKIGIGQRRMTAAFLTGLSFLFMPSTVYVLVLQSSFDVAFGVALMPGLLFFLYDFVQEKHRRALLGYTCLFCLLIAVHYILAIAFGIVILVYLLLHILVMRTWRFEMAAVGNTLFCYVVMGYFLYPALAGGILMKEYLSQGSWGLSVGGAIPVVAVFGLLMSDRTRASGFLTTVLLLGLSFAIAEPIRKLIPARALQESYWYLLAATALCLVVLLYWQRLRLVFLVVFLGVIVAEGIPQLQSLQDGDTALANKETIIGDYLLWEAAEETDNRLALLDNTLLGDFPHWYFAANDVSSMYGWDFENALTTRNMAYINEAFADGFYDYMFDRLFLYGNDVVVILKELLTEAGSYDALVASAGDSGYRVSAENNKVVILKAEQIEGSYGVVSDYENLAIGEAASPVAYIYPSFGIGRSDCIEDYTVDELAGYKKLYLSGFSYREKEKAENMLKEVSNRGTEIYIDMQHIPINKLTGKNEFMGVYAQFVQFTEQFPILENNNGNQFKLEFQTKDYATWNTVYISGCDTIVKETTYDGRRHLAYLGYNTEPNITFMGFNLLYHYLSTHNKDLKRFLDEALLFSEGDLPEPEVVPIEIVRAPEQIIVRTESDGVNCNIAGVETLVPDRIISTQENMWLVNRGETVFRIVRPKQSEGFFFSILGCIGISLLWITVYVVLEGAAGKKQDKN